MSIRWIGLLVACVLLPHAAGAEPPAPDYGRNGLTLGFEGVVGIYTEVESRLESAVPIVPAVTNVSVDDAFGVNGRVGYRLHPRAAVEAEFEYVWGPVAKVANNQKLARGKTWLATANAKGFILTRGRFQPFVLVGLGYLRTDVQLPLVPRFEKGGFATRLGVGFEGYFTPHLAFIFDTQYVLPTGSVKDLDSISIGGGLQWKF